MIQNVKTVRAGLRCKIRVMNHNGDDVLTTYDQGVATTCEAASETLEQFWSRCIDEHKVTPTIFGKRTGETDFDLLQVKDAPDFDLGLFEEILIQPAPLVGG